jgi:hypothetical protein
MSIRIKMNLLEPKWHEFQEGVSFLLTPFDHSKIHAAGGADDYEKAMIECVKGWNGLVDHKDNPFNFSEKHRPFVIANTPGLSKWIAEKVFELNRALTEQVKN